VNDTNWDYSVIDGSTIALADAINPDGINAYDPDIRPFQKAGGKVLEYHGCRGPVIPSGASGTWYDNVYEFNSELGETQELEKFYRLFMIAGLRRCSGGDGGTSLSQIMESRA
jgi:feruloyl esterase